MAFGDSLSHLEEIRSMWISDHPQQEPTSLCVRPKDLGMLHEYYPPPIIPGISLFSLLETGANMLLV